MGKTRKIKKLVAKASEYADHAERSARRAEAVHQEIDRLLSAMQQPPREDEVSQGGSPRPPIYTAPAGTGATPPAAEIPHP